MKKTKLLEFNNGRGGILRGILTYTDRTRVQSVVMMGGFERSATTEVKFKSLADKLAEHNVCSLRFDHAGVGLSDGDFSGISVKNLGTDLECAIEALQKKMNCEKISFVGHSLPPCIMANNRIKDIFHKLVFLSPALNQKELLRYWFVSSAAKERTPDIKINWDNFREYLDEDSFRKYCRDAHKMTKAHYFGSGYLLESADVDYARDIPDADNILHIHGEKDNTVPLASLTKKFSRSITIKDGDHDIERPDMIKQWIDKTIEFLII